MPKNETSEIFDRLGFELWQIRDICAKRSTELVFCKFEDYHFQLSKRNFLGFPLERDILHIKVSCDKSDIIADVLESLKKLEKTLFFAGTNLKFELLIP